jgi:hypothetical protein
VAFGKIFLMIPTNCLEKPSQKTLRLSHRFHSAYELRFLKTFRGAKHNISFTPITSSELKPEVGKRLSHCGKRIKVMHLALMTRGRSMGTPMKGFNGTAC